MMMMNTYELISPKTDPFNKKNNIIKNQINICTSKCRSECAFIILENKRFIRNSYLSKIKKK